MAKLSELLQFGILKKLRLVTSSNCEDTNVGTVTVMEVPDIIQWLRGDDFLITSLYSIGDDEERQCQLVRDLTISQSSCLAIKTGKYAHHISDKMIQIANENNFPLLHIPYEITYIDIIMDAMSVIMTESNRRDILAKYISKLIFPESSNDKMLIEEGQLLKIDLENDCFQALVVNMNMESALEGCAFRTVKFAMEKVVDFSDSLSESVSCGYFKLERGAMVLLYARDKSFLDQFVPFVLAEMKCIFNNMSLPYEWKVGIGKVRSTAAGIRQSYLQAIQSIELGRILKKGEQFYRFEELELYGNLQDMLLSKPRGLFEKTLGRLKNQELVDTLVMYFECDGNLDEAASRLYTHKNTIKYRLNKIKDLTGLDVKCQEDNFKLYFMVLEKKLCGK